MEPGNNRLTKNQKIKELTDINDDLENYLRNTIIPQLFFDKELILRKFTPAVMIQFDLSESDIGRSVFDIINNLRYPSLIENINWVLGTSMILEKEIQTTDFSWFQMNITPYLRKSDNSINGVIITFIDITKRVKDLKEQEKIIGEYDTLLETISHDIKNRLNGMLLSIQLLNSSDFQDTGEVKFYLETLETGVNRINETIGELVDSRDQKHRYEAMDELLNIEHILEDVKFALISEITKTNATIKIEVNSSEIVFPRRQLRSIIYNLASNALKFRSPDRNPEILIKAIREGNYIILTVRDNGIGIDSSQHEDVFSKFFRVENSLEGSGIGLHLVKTLVTNAGGKVEIESDLGVGTEFKIYLKAKFALAAGKELFV